MASLLRIFLIVWVLNLAFLLVSFMDEKFYPLFFFLLLVLFGLSMLITESYKKNVLRLKKKIERTKKETKEDVEIKEQTKEWNFKISSLENEIENFKIINEKKYREVVRKVLELENEINKKYKLLGEAVIKLSKKKNH